jgi:hypothetical protein
MVMVSNGPRHRPTMPVTAIALAGLLLAACATPERGPPDGARCAR